MKNYAARGKTILQDTKKQNSGLPAAIIEEIVQRFRLDLRGPHGMPHWARVYENAMQIADMLNMDAEDRQVLALFSVLHDSERVTDGPDPDHGTRGAQIAEEMRGTYFQMSDRHFAFLHKACKYHNQPVTCADPVVQTCWDADRLDLGRLNIRIDTSFLSNSTGQNPSLIEAADRRGRSQAENHLLYEWAEHIGGARPASTSANDNKVSIVTDGAFESDKIIFVHMAQGHPRNGRLMPNIAYEGDRHALFRIPRVVVEFCLNGTILRDRNFSHMKVLSFVRFDQMMRRNGNNFINIWPTGSTVMGSVDISEEALVVFDPQTSPRCPDNHTEPYVLEAFPASDPAGKAAYMQHVLERNDVPFMRIVPREEGFQSSTWQEVQTGVDWLEPGKDGFVAEGLGNLSARHGIPNATHGYGFAAGKYMSRLCEFFACFQRTGFDYWWTNFAINQAPKTLERYKTLFKAATESLDQQNAQSPAWRIVSLYSDIAFFIMQTQIDLFRAGKFGLDFLDPAPLKGHPADVTELFYAGGQPVEDNRTAEDVFKVARAFRALRDNFSSQSAVEYRHPLIGGLVDIANEAGIICDAASARTVQDILVFWAKIIDQEFPEFGAQVDRLVHKL